MTWIVVEQDASQPLKPGDRIVVERGKEGISWGVVKSTAGADLRVVAPMRSPVGYASHGAQGVVKSIVPTSLHFHGDEQAVKAAVVEF